MTEKVTSTSFVYDEQQPRGVEPKGLLVSERRLELPPGLTRLGPQPSASTNSATPTWWDEAGVYRTHPQYGQSRVTCRQVSLQIVAVPEFDVPGEPGTGRIVLEATDLVLPHRSHHRMCIQRNDDQIVRKNVLSLLDQYL